MESETEDENFGAFDDMNLDDRLLKAIGKLGWAEPTPIQEKAIPLTLAGKDILMRARTGSGKTGAFAIPAIEKVLQAKHSAAEQAVRVILLTPTKELCQQATSVFKELTSCSRDVSVVDISATVPLDQQKGLLFEKPDIVVATPSRVAAHLHVGSLSLEQVQLFIVDECDLIFSLGFEDEMKSITRQLPSVYQAILSSATLSTEVRDIKKLVLHNPVVLRLQDSPADEPLPPPSQLSQYYVHASHQEKYTIFMSLLKLKLLRGRTLVFVNTVDRCYRLKLFLEQFGIKCCILNPELPINVRCQVVSQFNDGVYDLIVAADCLATESKKGSRRSSRADKESASSRGIDFQFVSNVVNFDFPTSVTDYIHRVGRTARATHEGTAFSFVAPSEEDLRADVEKGCNTQLQPYTFSSSELDGFRYRANDALKALTKTAIRQARLKEVKTEILNSKRLKGYLATHEKDMQLLRHDHGSHTVKEQPHLKHVPDYIIPQSLRHSKVSGRSRKSSTKRHQTTPKEKTQARKKADPLQSFEFLETATGEKGLEMGKPSKKKRKKA